MSRIAGEGSGLENSAWVSVVRASRPGLKCAAAEMPGNQFTRLWMIQWKF